MQVLARFFIPTVGVRIKMLEYSSQKGENAVIISDLVKNTAEKWGIKKKVTAFSADNCVTNFGSVSRGGKNNANYLLKQWKLKLIGIGCAAHIVHNALKTACDSLPIDIECFVVKIYSFFSYLYCTR